MSNWSIRAAKPSDAPDLQRCMEAAYRSYSERLDGQILPPLAADYAQEIANYPSWVALRSEKLVGGLIMTFSADAATLSNIAVHPLAQGLGLGRGLLDFAENAARSRGYDRLLLATHVLLTENVSLYEHLGWRVTGKDDARVYMQKAI